MIPLSPDLKASDAELLAGFRQLTRKSDVADLLEIPPSYLKSILYVRRDRQRYRLFVVPKRSGRSRTISAPPPSLAILQHKLNRIFQLAYKPKPCVHGFVGGRSILSNASPHVTKRWVLNVDLQDFFPSIHLGRIRGALMARPYGLTTACATVIAQICTSHDGILPQGAPTSPVLANIICSRLDGELTALAKRYGLAYTRYCDDLSFSSRHVNFPADIAVAGASWIGDGLGIGPALRDVIESNRFKINAAKSRLQSRSCHQEVTGLTVNAFPNVSRRYVRQLRAMMHNWRELGLAAAAAVYEAHHEGAASNGDFRRVLRGRVEYVGMVRGRTDPVYCKLREALHAIEPSLIGPAPAPSEYRLPQRSIGGDRWTRLFARWQGSVFHLTATKPNGDTMSATAFGFTDDTIATAGHNLSESGVVQVRGMGGVWSLDRARVHSRGARELDCALLQQAHGAERQPYATRIPSPGESVAVVGFATVPQRHPGVGLYVGAVESIRQNYSLTTEFIHISIASGGGMSGSPVFNSSGRLLGIVIESVFEQTRNLVPHREYCTVLPIKYLLEIDRASLPISLPISI